MLVYDAPVPVLQKIHVSLFPILKSNSVVFCCDIFDFYVFFFPPIKIKLLCLLWRHSLFAFHLCSLLWAPFDRLPAPRTGHGLYDLYDIFPLDVDLDLSGQIDTLLICRIY